MTAPRQSDGLDPAKRRCAFLEIAPQHVVRCAYAEEVVHFKVAVSASPLPFVDKRYGV